MFIGENTIVKLPLDIINIFLNKEIKVKKILLVLLLSMAINAKPIQPTIGISIDRIYDVNTKGNSFKAVFWLWSVSSLDENYTMESLEYVNGLNMTELQKYIEVKNKKVWTTKKIKGEFAVKWDLKKYPFDTQTLKIILEDGDMDCEDLVFKIDKNSILNQDLYINNWNLKGMLRDNTYCHTLYTTYGDPSLDEYSESTYERAVFSIDVVRGKLREAMTVLLPIGLAFFISWLGFLVYRDYAIKTTLFLSSLFLLIGIKNNIDSSLHTDNMVLVDYYIFFTFVGIMVYLITILLSMYVKNDKTVKTINRVSMVYTMVLYILFNAGVTIWFLSF